MPLAVNVGAATVPEASVPTVAVLALLAEKRPLAPAAGALNVTGTPAVPVTAQPSLLVSATCSPLAKAPSSVVVCGVPATSVSWLGGLDVGQLELGVLSPGEPLLPAFFSLEAKAGAPAVAPAQAPRPAASRSASAAWRTPQRSRAHASAGAARRPPWRSRIDAPAGAARLPPWRRSRTNAVQATAAGRPVGRLASCVVIG